MHEQMINAGEVPDPGPPDGATPEGSSEGDEHNGEESDEEGKVPHRVHHDAFAREQKLTILKLPMLMLLVQIQSQSPDGDIVTPGNFDKHMEAQPTHRLLNKYFDRRYILSKYMYNVKVYKYLNVSKCRSFKVEK